MIWLVVVLSLVVVVLSTVCIFLTVALSNFKERSEVYLEQWQKWERLWSEVQGELLENHNIFISSSKGAYGKMLIEKKESDDE